MNKILKSEEFGMKNFPIRKDGKTYWISRSIAVLGLVVCEHNNETFVLVNKRGDGCPDYNGMWNIPCGYLDYNETTKEAVCREIWEECGIKFMPSQFELFGVNDDPNDSNNQNVTLRYFAKVPESYMIGGKLSDSHSEENEVSDIKWVNVKDIDNMEWAFNHYSVLKDILPSLL